MLHVSNIVDENTVEVSDSRTLKVRVANVNELRTEGTKVFGLTQSRVVAYRDVEDFLTRYALRQKLVNPDYEYVFEYADNEVRVSGIDIHATGAVDLEIPDFIDTIGDFAFQDMSDIRSAYIPDSVVRLGRSCFYNCSSLESVRLSQSLPYLVDDVFCWCTALTSIVIPEDITILGGHCFTGCKALTGIVIPEGVTTLGEYCFYCCTGLESIVLPSTVTHIGSHCFADCFSLEDINISDTSIDELSSYCFSMCRSLKSLELPDSLQKIGKQVITGCFSLEEIRIHSLLLDMLENRTFYDCINLRRLTIVELSMSSSMLNSVPYPETLSSAFTKCGKLSTIRVEDIAENSISDIETFIRHFKKGVPSIEILEIDKSVGISLDTISEELGIEIRPLEE